MMKDEFEKRFGCEVSPAVYARVEQIYLDSNDVDKDAFVKRCKKENLVVKIQQDIIYQLIESLSEVYDAVDKQMAAEQKVLSDTRVKTQAETLVGSLTVFGQERPELDAYRRRVHAQASYLACDDIKDRCHDALAPFFAELLLHQVKQAATFCR